MSFTMLSCFKTTRTAFIDKASSDRTTRYRQLMAPLVMKLITVNFLQRELHSFTKQETGTKQNSTTCLKMSVSKTTKTLR